VHQFVAQLLGVVSCLREDEEERRGREFVQLLRVVMVVQRQAHPWLPQ
jgi:hypothetical protein